jgi:lipopolysaccharide assembly protein A
MPNARTSHNDLVRVRGVQGSELPYMKYLHWIFRVLLFVVLLGFAIKNTDPVVVRYFLGWEWRAPLALVLLMFFVAGAALGLIAAVGWLYHQRRELQQLRRERRETRPDASVPDAPPERRLL